MDRQRLAHAKHATAPVQKCERERRDDSKRERLSTPSTNAASTSRSPSVNAASRTKCFHVSVVVERTARPAGAAAIGLLAILETSFQRAAPHPGS
jgi:hypothetical protein